MRNFRTALLASTAAALLGLSGAALAQSSALHTMTVQLPGGGIAEISYPGNVPPQITVGSGSAAIGNLLPPSSMSWASPVAMLGRISAEMNREAATLFRYADALMSQPLAAPDDGMAVTGRRYRSPGTQEFSYISTVFGNGVCVRRTEITATGNARPRVVTRSSGGCGPSSGLRSNGTGAVTLPSAPAAAKRPDVLWTKNGATQQPYVTMVRNASWQR